MFVCVLLLLRCLGERCEARTSDKKRPGIRTTERESHGKQTLMRRETRHVTASACASCVCQMPPIAHGGGRLPIADCACCPWNETTNASRKVNTRDQLSRFAEGKWCGLKVARERRQKSPQGPVGPLHVSVSTTPRVVAGERVPHKTTNVFQLMNAKHAREEGTLEKRSQPSATTRAHTQTLKERSIAPLRH